MLKKLISNALNRLGKDKDGSKMDKFIDKCNDKKLSDFLKGMLVKYDSTCELFELFYIQLAKKIGITDFYQQNFILIL